MSPKSRKPRPEKVDIDPVETALGNQDPGVKEALAQSRKQKPGEKNRTAVARSVGGRESVMPPEELRASEDSGVILGKDGAPG